MTVNAQEIAPDDDCQPGNEDVSLLDKHDQERTTQVNDWVSRTEYGEYIIDAQIVVLVPNRPSGLHGRRIINQSINQSIPPMLRLTSRPA